MINSKNLKLFLLFISGVLFLGYSLAPTVDDTLLRNNQAIALESSHETSIVTSYPTTALLEASETTAQPISTNKADTGTDTGLELDYTLTISNPSSHLVHIQLEISNLSTNILYLARKKDELIPNIINLTISNQNGAGVPFVFDDSLSIVEVIQVETSGMSGIIVSYDVDLSYTDNGSGYSYWGLDFAFGLVGPIFIFYQPVEGAQISSARLHFELPDGWDAVTRFQKIGGYYQINPDDVMIWWEGDKVFPFFIFGGMAFGDFDYYQRTVGGIDVLVAFFSDEDVEEEMIAERIFTTVEYASNTLGKLPKSSGQDGFVYVFHDQTQGHIHGGMHEFGQITVMDVGKFPEWQGMAHMMFHNWFLTPDTENRLWRPFYVTNHFSEGFIQHYALQSVKETGIWETWRINDLLQNWFNDYASFILGTEYDVPLTSDEWGSFPYDIWKVGMYKKAPLTLRLLSWKIEDVTGEAKNIDDVMQLLRDQRTGPSEYLMADDYLEAVNWLTGYDFSGFWEAYIHGAQPLPFNIINGQLVVDESAMPEAPRLTGPELVRLDWLWYQGQSDNDHDGLTNHVEKLIGTNSQKTDSDLDGLSDREEFGVIIDGQSGEYGVDKPIISDPQGDSLSSEPGTDIKIIDAKIFMDEDGDKELYLVMSTWDDQYNPDAWYEILLDSEVYECQFRLDEHQISHHLWCRENENPETEISPERISVQFEKLLEVKIPLVLLPELGSTFSATGLIRHGEDEIHEHGLKNVDTTDWATTTVVPEIYITDPLDSDSDGDGISDGVEVQFGSDPTDPTSINWRLHLPIVTWSR